MSKDNSDLGHFWLQSERSHSVLCGHSELVCCPCMQPTDVCLLWGSGAMPLLPLSSPQIVAMVGLHKTKIYQLVPDWEIPLVLSK